jgi:isoprenylcysteine carboxyl methyltransferase (ICMT) family protein YpbQ
MLGLLVLTVTDPKTFAEQSKAQGAGQIHPAILLTIQSLFLVACVMVIIAYKKKIRWMYLPFIVVLVRNFRLFFELRWCPILIFWGK